MEEIDFPLKRTPVTRPMIERSLERQMPRDGPEFELVAAVVAQAVIDLDSGESAAVRRDAEEFLGSEDFDWWCNLGGLEPDHVIRMARELKNFKEMERGMFSKAQEKFIRGTAGIGFAKVRNIMIKDGMPSMSRRTQVVRSFCFGKEERAGDDPVKAERCYADLFRECERIGQGMILSLDFQNGMPVHMTAEKLEASHG